MFLIFSKEKIFTYVISIITVIILFYVANNINLNQNQIIQTVANTDKMLPIYNVKTEENKISLTMNCAWNADDIDKILKVLEDNNVKITFFIVGDWIDKYPNEVIKIKDAGHEIRRS